MSDRVQGGCSYPDDETDIPEKTHIVQIHGHGFTIKNCKEENLYRELSSSLILGRGNDSDIAKQLTETIFELMAEATRDGTDIYVSRELNDYLTNQLENVYSDDSAVSRIHNLLGQHLLDQLMDEKTRKSVKKWVKAAFDVMSRVTEGSLRLKCSFLSSKQKAEFAKAFFQGKISQEICEDLRAKVIESIKSEQGKYKDMGVFQTVLRRVMKTIYFILECPLKEMSHVTSDVNIKVSVVRGKDKKIKVENLIPMGCEADIPKSSFGSEGDTVVIAGSSHIDSDDEILEESSVKQLETEEKRSVYERYKDDLKAKHGEVYKYFIRHQRAFPKSFYLTLESLTLMDSRQLQVFESKMNPSVKDKLNVDDSRLILSSFTEEFINRGEAIVNRYKDKIINDPILGSIVIHPLARVLIDTPQFQRLRDMKKLGVMERVYPGATHTLFVHSLGNYHIAGKLITFLSDNQPELKISKRENICFRLAALCQEIGRGPFSPMFEEILLPAVLYEEANPDYKWDHTVATLAILDEMWTIDNVKGTFAEFGLADGIDEIKALITGTVPKGKEDKEFLYTMLKENKNSGLDIAKWDTLCRDAEYLGIRNKFDYKRFIHHLRVLPPKGDVKGTLRLCVRDKEILTVNEVFQDLDELASKAYRHYKHTGIELMVAEAILKCKDLKEQLVDCLRNPLNVIKLTDCYIWGQVKKSANVRSRMIISDLNNRKLWKYLGHTSMPIERNKDSTMKATGPQDTKTTADSYKDERTFEKEFCKLSTEKLSPDDFVVRIVDVDYGDAPPALQVQTFKKTNIDVYTPENENERKKKLNEEGMLMKFSKRMLFVYCINPLKSTTISEAFEKWCDEREESTDSEGYYHKPCDY